MNVLLPLALWRKWSRKSKLFFGVTLTISGAGFVSRSFDVRVTPRAVEQVDANGESRGASLISSLGRTVH